MSVQKLRQQMLQSMSDAISTEPPKNPAEVQMSADAVVGLTTQGDELTDAAQVSLNKSTWFYRVAASLLTNLSYIVVTG